MSYARVIPLSLGSSKTGLVLAAQLVDQAGSNVGSEVTSGFVEFGGGLYHWYYAGFPDGFRGTIKFYEQGEGEILYIHTVNPEDAEGAINIDSTGGTLTLAKALEVILARCMGNLSYNEETAVLTFKGRDGTTAVATVKLTGGGNRSDSAIP